MKIALRATFLSKSTYYHKPEPAKDRRKRPLDKKLVAELRELPKYEQTYGYRKVTKYLSGYNHKKIYRHMKELNLTQPRKLKNIIRAVSRSPVPWEQISDGKEI